ncbi:MAG: class I tRNA ligase family protein, partial [Propionibacterium sp.]|nr:class I tRNA ligase family protein [Propionibacterium sp.]
MTSFNLSITVGSRCVAAACAWTGADGLTVEPVELGVGGTAPSVAFVDPAGELIFGDLALQLARDQPQRAIFDLQERVGDGIPLLIGGRRLDPAQLYARLVGWVVDRSADQFRDMVASVDATNDFFIRTTDPGHVERVQRVVEQVKENGYVYKGTYE